MPIHRGEADPPNWTGYETTRARVDGVEREIERRKQEAEIPERASATEAGLCGEREAGSACQVATEGANPRGKSSHTHDKASIYRPSKRIRTQIELPIVEAETLCMRGLAIQWPSSQLILMGAQTEEVREYNLGYRKICEAKRETWIVETPGRHPIWASAHATTNAICNGRELPSRPHKAQIVGTVIFDDVFVYDITRAGVEQYTAVRNHMCSVQRRSLSSELFR